MYRMVTAVYKQKKNRETGNRYIDKMSRLCYNGIKRWGQWSAQHTQEAHSNETNQ